MYKKEILYLPKNFMIFHLQQGGRMGAKLNTKSFKDLEIINEVTKGKTLKVISREVGVNHKRVDRVVNEYQHLLSEAFEQARRVVGKDMLFMVEICQDTLRGIILNSHNNRDKIMAVNSYLKLLEATGLTAQPVVDSISATKGFKK